MPVDAWNMPEWNDALSLAGLMPSVLLALGDSRRSSGLCPSSWATKKPRPAHHPHGDPAPESPVAGIVTGIRVIMIGRRGPGGGESLGTRTRPGGGFYEAGPPSCCSHCHGPSSGPRIRPLLDF
jgi:hypothetical protein